MGGAVSAKLSKKAKEANRYSVDPVRNAAQSKDRLKGTIKAKVLHRDDAKTAKQEREEQKELGLKEEAADDDDDELLKEKRKQGRAYGFSLKRKGEDDAAQSKAAQEQHDKQLKQISELAGDKLSREKESYDSEVEREISGMYERDDFELEFESRLVEAQRKEFAGHAKEQVLREEEGLEEEVQVFQPPSSFTPVADADKLPDEDLSLEWVHGFGSHGRGQVMYSKSSDVLYQVGTKAMLLQPKTGQLRVFHNHRKTINAMCVDVAGSIVATGESGSRPRINIWSAGTLDLLATLKGIHDSPIISLAFSHDATHLASLANSTFNTVVLWRWRHLTHRVACHVKLLSESFFQIAFNRSLQSEKMCVVGTAHVSFMTTQL